MERAADILSSIDDKERLDWLQKQLDKAEYTGECVFRWSTSGRGWRLHEVSGEAGPIYGVTPTSSVRKAIDEGMQREIDESSGSGVEGDSGQTDSRPSD